MSSPVTPPTRPAVRVRKRRPLAADGRHHRRRAVTYGLLALAAVLMVHALVGENGYLAGLRASREYDHLMAELGRVRLENQQLVEQAKRLREDPNAIEEAARRDLGLLRTGETLVIVKDVRGHR
jgi:cell division protein FtsB